MAAASRTLFGAASRRRARILPGSPPPLRGRSAQRSCAGRGVSLLVWNLPPSLTLPQSKSDVSDLDQSSNRRTREHPSSAGGGDPPSIVESPRILPRSTTVSRLVLDITTSPSPSAGS